jgi:hypothetical protein
MASPSAKPPVKDITLSSPAESSPAPSSLYKLKSKPQNDTSVGDGLSTPEFAQTSKTSSLAGKVIDENGSAVASAMIIDKKNNIAVETDTSGSFCFIRGIAISPLRYQHPDMIQEQ